MQPLNIIGSFQGGLQNALAGGQAVQQMNAQQAEMQRQGEMRNWLMENGPALAQGDPNALAGYAQFDPKGAFTMGQQVQQNEMASARFGQQTEMHEARITQLREQGRRQAEAHVAQMSAAEREREAAETETALRSAAMAYKQGPEAFEAWKQQNAAMFEQFETDPAAVTYENFPDLAAVAVGGLEALKGPGPDWVTIDDQLVDRNAQGGPAVVPVQGMEGDGGDGDMTESQRRIFMFNNIQRQTGPAINTIEENGFDPSNIQDKLSGGVLGGNFFRTTEGQMYNAAASAWSESALRLATGAAATPEEYERARNMYFAAPGDSPETIQFKRAMRESYQNVLEATLRGDLDAQPPNPLGFAVEQYYSGRNGADAGGSTGAPQRQGQPGQAAPQAPQGQPAPQQAPAMGMPDVSSMTYDEISAFIDENPQINEATRKALAARVRQLMGEG